MRLTAPRIFAIGTHHKTGTLWMRAVFRKLAQATGVPERPVYPGTGPRIVPPRTRIYLTAWSSRFPEWLPTRPDVRILHLIRDPRDVLLSGMRYHRHAPVAGEAFLHRPRDDLGGLTYQAHLNALPDDAARLRFEMGEKHAITLREMLDWEYGRPNAVELRYEDLIADTECRRFREALRHLGLPEQEVETGLDIYWNNALFGGLADGARRRGRVRSHVADGRGGQWRRALPRSVAVAYAERHGADLVALGYADHPTAWLGELEDDV